MRNSGGEVQSQEGRQIYLTYTKPGYIILDVSSFPRTSNKETVSVLTVISSELQSQNWDSDTCYKLEQQYNNI